MLVRPLRTEPLLAAALAAALVWLGPQGTDLAAHAYQRTLWAEHGFVLWNNFWYAGRYSFINYSVLYYPLATLLGIRLLAVLTVALTVAAFSAVVRHEWGARSRWSIRVFAVAWAALVVSAAFPFMLGCAFTLLALWALQHGRRLWFAALALCALAASPLAFILLVIVLIGIALARRREAAAFAAPAAAVAALVGVEVLLQRMFPAHGRFPFSGAEYAAALTFCLLGLALTWCVAEARALRWMFAAYLAACTVAFFVSSPMGENIARLRFVAAPIAVLTMSLRNWRPRLVCVGVLALAISWNVTPLAASFARGVEDPAAHAAYWAPAKQFLQSHLQPGYRVEAVDTANHWPADFLARARIPLARGWFRQEDFPQNRVLYGPLGKAAYLAWLRKLSVRYVVLTSRPPDYSSRGEAALLQSGRTHLKIVYATSNLWIYAVPSPRPLVSPPAHVRSVGYSTIALDVPHRGTYALSVTYTPYWQSRTACLEQTPDGMTRLVVRRPGLVRLRFAVTPRRALATITGDASDTCR
ncbi:MAG TPA: hypothetical protein VLB89_00880 [Gaiellaceae bacterium]|nr:hypothetical protein [Gaiellaceae bacterium]